MIERIGARRVGIRPSPFSTVGNMPGDERTEETYLALSRELGARQVAYVHFVDTSIFVPDDGTLTRQVRAFLAQARQELGRTPVVLAGDLSQHSAAELIASGLIDIAAFGRPYISNPDLVERFRDGIPLARPNLETFFGGDANGYIDYPTAAG